MPKQRQDVRYVSRLTRKSQVTMPSAVRETLGVAPGDYIAYELHEGGVSIRRVEPFDLEFHKALSQTLDEWSTPEDDEAFRDL
jgi:antitoxin PrlF